MSTGKLQASHPAYQGSSEPAWLVGMRREALLAFEQVGFPGPRTEAWKYSNPKHIAAVDWALATSKALHIDGFRLPHAELELVFVNGHFSPELSRGETPEAHTLQSAIQSGAAQGQLAQFTSESSEACQVGRRFAIILERPEECCTKCCILDVLLCSMPR